MASRSVGHYLRPHERSLYEKSLKKRYLEITTKHRDNLWHIWEKACIAQGWQSFILVKEAAEKQASLYIDGKLEGEYELDFAKQYVQQKAKHNFSSVR